MIASIENQRVVVAGGSSGIGLVIAQLAAQHYAQVTITGRSTQKLEIARQATATLQTAVVDSGDRMAVDAFFKKHGLVDHLIIAVSGGKGAGDFRSLSLDDLREAFEGKFWPQLHTLQAALPYMSPRGSITLITAVSASAKLPGTSGLGALNGALETMVPVLAKELKPLRINAVSPGVVDTTWWDFLPAEVKKQVFEQYAGQIPVGRIAKPQEIADTILFLLGNTYMTGCVVACDGGLSS